MAYEIRGQLRDVMFHSDRIMPGSVLSSFSLPFNRIDVITDVVKTFLHPDSHSAQPLCPAMDLSVTGRTSPLGSPVMAEKVTTLPLWVAWIHIKICTLLLSLIKTIKSWKTSISPPHDKNTGRWLKTRKSQKVSGTKTGVLTSASVPMAPGCFAISRMLA